MMRKGLVLFRRKLRPRRISLWQIILLLLLVTQTGLGQEKINPAPQRGARVNINTASAPQLQTLPGIGPVKAQAIINARPYASIDELTRAGGIGPKTLENLRLLITVGEVIEGAPEPGVPTPKAPGKININTASSLKLQTLPGIGPVTAKAIIDNRPYFSIDELTRVRRIGPKTVENLRDLITVGEVSPGERPGIRKIRKVNINTASQRELETLPGIGPTLAQAIIRHRPYRHISDIQNVPRIGPKTYEGLADLITVEKPDINEATLPELLTVLGMREEMARSIINYRNTQGPFKSMRELKDVPGMDDETYRLLRNRFAIGGGRRPEVKRRRYYRKSEPPSYEEQEDEPEEEED